MKNLSTWTAILSIIVSACGSTEQHTIYVSPSGDDSALGAEESPVGTIAKALTLINEIRVNDEETVVIHLMEGEYHLPASIVITPAYKNLVVKGAGANKTIVKGSKALELSWEKYDENIWVSETNAELDFNQLVINDQVQILARYPNYDPDGEYWNGHAEDAIAKERVNTWKNPKDGLVHALHAGKWGGFHYQIKSADKQGNLELTGGHQNNRPSGMHRKIRMVENIFEELDSENEWYYDKEEGKLYLWPDENLDLNKARVEVSQLKHLIELRGTLEKPVMNVTIEGISFKHSKRTLMEPYSRLLRSDWRIYRGGAVLMEGTESCAILDCEFSHLGGNVIFVNAYNRNVSIQGNHIHHVGASAISFVGDSTAVRSPSYQYSEYVSPQEMDTVTGPANEQYPSGCLVEDNLIYKIGAIEKQVAGVQISMSMKIHIKNNSIYEVPRSGINVSEGTWGGHLIENNDVFKTVMETSDHGAFNSWGRDRFWHPKWQSIDSLVKANPEMPLWDAMHTTIIRNNRFRCDHGWDIDLDDGSTNYHIYNNLCLKGGIKLREGYHRKVENNIMVNNGFHPHVWFSNSEDVFRKNIMMTRHFPIRLEGWGSEVDFNLFPDATSLALAQANNTDANSLYGKPLFANPDEGDFRIQDTSLAVQLGFENFPMDAFGVQKPALKAIAGQPEIPALIFKSSTDEMGKTFEWLGGEIKNVETEEEQSAYGLNTMSGVIITKILKGSKLAQSGILERDVITSIDNKEINNVNEFMNRYEEIFRYKDIELIIVRNQQQIEIVIDE